MLNRKILTVEELINKINKSKSEGSKVAQCHGCFDLLHVGHMKYLNKSKEIADVLVVTVTPDKYIFKGPNRPVFNEFLRIEALANLECVDYVCLNDAFDAVEIIKKLKPNYYIKGNDYIDFSTDITGKIVEEKYAVESVGGELIVTNEQSFSSTNILNCHLQYFPENIQRFIDKIRKDYSKDEILSYLERIKSIKVSVIGDPIVDEYLFCRPVGTVTKSPTLSAIFRNELRMIGGGLAIANHVAEFVDDVEYIGVVGDRNNAIEFITKKLEESGIYPNILINPDKFVPLKRRFVADVVYPTTLKGINSTGMQSMQKLFEIGFIEEEYLDTGLEKKLIHLIKKSLIEKDMFIVADFGHGMYSPKVAQAISKLSRWWSLNVQTNSTNYGFNLITNYKKPNFFCIDELEARLCFGDRYSELEQITKRLSTKMECDNFMITLGSNGIIMKNGSILKAPALATNIIDTVGAGDAVLSMASLCAYSNIPDMINIFFSSVMGAIASQVICNIEPVRKHKFVKFIEGVF